MAEDDGSETAESGRYVPTSSDFLRLIRVLRKVGNGRSRGVPSFQAKDALSLWSELVDSIDTFVREHPNQVPPPYRQLQGWHAKETRLRRIAEYLVADPYPQNNYSQEWFEKHRDLASQVKSGAVFTQSCLDRMFESRPLPPVAKGFGMAVWACHYATIPEWRQILVEVSDALENQDQNKNASSPVQHQPKKEQKKSKSARRREAQEKNVIGSLTGRVHELEAELKNIRSKDAASLNTKRLEFEAAAQQNERLGAELAKARTDLAKRKGEVHKAQAERDFWKGNAEDIGLQLQLSIEQGADLTNQVCKLESALADARCQLEAAPKGAASVSEYIEKQIEDCEIRATVDQGEPGRCAGERLSQMKQFKQAFLEIEPSFRVNVTPPVMRQPARGEIQFESLGGGNEIGASCHLLRVGGAEVLIDAGTRANRDLQEMGPDLGRWAIEDPLFEAVIITHAHGDHCGWLPSLAKRWSFDVYCTVETNKLLNVMLEDAYNNMQRELGKANLRAKYLGQPPIGSPYDREDVETALRRVRPMHFTDLKSIGDNLAFSLLPAGHILGAASVLVEGWNRRVMITGDYSCFAQETVFPLDWSEAAKGEIDLLVSEATYGIPRKKQRDAQIQLFLEYVRNTLSKSGTVLIPCFALGRAQEVLAILGHAFDRRQLTPCPVWIDGLIDKIIPIYEAAERFVMNPTFRYRRNGWDIPEVIHTVEQEPSIVVTTSGMLAGGPVVEYAQRLLPNPKNQMILCGYQDEESPGGRLIRDATNSDAARRILELEEESGEKKRVMLGSRAVAVELSAHSDAIEMVDAIKKLNPKHIVLVHGTDSGRKALAEALRQEGLSVETAPSIRILRE